MTPIHRVRPAEIEDREAVLDKGVSALLGDHRLGRYWVAENADGQVIGQAMVTFEWSDWRNGMIWWLQSVYVDKAYRRQGVFHDLYQQIRSEAEREPLICALRLYVERKNRNAQETYVAMGMVDTGYQVMEEILTP